MVRLVIVAISVVVVVLMTGFSLIGAVNNNTVVAKTDITPQSVGAISQQLNTTLQQMFPHIHVLVLTDSSFSHGALKNTKMELEKGWNSSTPFSYILLGNLKTRSVSYNLSKSLLNSNPNQLKTGLLYAVNGNKNNLAVDNFVFTTPIIVVTHNPNGMYFVNTATSNDNGIISVLKYYENGIGNHISSSTANSVNSATPAELTNNGFTFLTNYGWYDYSASASSGQTVLIMQDFIAVYGTTQSTSQGTYYFVMAYTTNSAKGYSVSNSWYSYFFGTAPFYYEHFKPNTFESTVNWETNTFAGQELFSWGPQNSGNNAYVSWTLSAGISSAGPSITAGVSYGVQGGITYSWADQSTPSSGIAKTKNSIGSSASSGTLYTVHPSSVGELNPTKSGGVPPMLFYAYFSVNSQTDTSGIPLYPQQYSLSSPDIYMSVY